MVAHGSFVLDCILVFLRQICVSTTQGEHCGHRLWQCLNPSWALQPTCHLPQLCISRGNTWLSTSSKALCPCLITFSYQFLEVELLIQDIMNFISFEIHYQINFQKVIHSFHFLEQMLLLSIMPFLKYLGKTVFS